MERWRSIPSGNTHTNSYFEPIEKSWRNSSVYYMLWIYNFSSICFTSPVCVFVCVLLTLLRTKKCFSYDFPSIRLRSLIPFFLPFYFSLTHLSHMIFYHWYFFTRYQGVKKYLIQNLIFSFLIFSFNFLSLFTSVICVGSIKENLMHSWRSSSILYFTSNTNFRFSPFFHDE